MSTTNNDTTSRLTASHWALAGLAGVGVAALGFLVWKKNRSPPNAFQQLLEQFRLSEAQLHHIRRHLIDEMTLGLTSKGSSLKMIPSYVERLASGKEKGNYYALDLGGTNFRVLRATLNGDGTLGEMKAKAYTIPNEKMIGPGVELFDFIAEAVQEFMAENPDPVTPSFGFTFSFPVDQTSKNSGKLIAWTKGFAAPGVEGQDVVQLLSDAFRRKGVRATVAALVNDTVGTMLARSYNDQTTYIGVILGTGTNACYLEKMSEIPKLAASGLTSSDMVINMEWGNFDEQKKVLPLTEFDRELDKNSLNKGKQLFEKMISGMYLGEIARLALVKLISAGVLFPGQTVPESLTKPYEFQSKFMSNIEEDSTDTLSQIDQLLRNELKITYTTTIEDRNIIKQICRAVGVRAARLAAVGICAVVEKIRKAEHYDCTVAVDGSVFEHYPGFKDTMEVTLAELLKEDSKNIRLKLTKDGSGIGAAVIAALG